MCTMPSSTLFALFDRINQFNTAWLFYNCRTINHPSIYSNQCIQSLKKNLIIFFSKNDEKLGNIFMFISILIRGKRL